MSDEILTKLQEVRTMLQKERDDHVKWAGSMVRINHIITWREETLRLRTQSDRRTQTLANAQKLTDAYQKLTKQRRE